MCVLLYWQQVCGINPNALQFGIKLAQDYNEVEHMSHHSTHIEVLNAGNVLLLQAHRYPENMNVN